MNFLFARRPRSRHDAKDVLDLQKNKYFRINKNIFGTTKIFFPQNIFFHVHFEWIQSASILMNSVTWLRISWITWCVYIRSQRIECNNRIPSRNYWNRCIRWTLYVHRKSHISQVFLIKYCHPQNPFHTKMFGFDEGTFSYGFFWCLAALTLALSLPFDSFRFFCVFCWCLTQLFDFQKANMSYSIHVQSKKTPRRPLSFHTVSQIGK